MGLFYHNCHHPLIKCRGVVLVVRDEFQSQHCLIIHYTSGERLEGFTCCEGLKLLERH